MSQDFYPFVDNTTTNNSASSNTSLIQPSYAARIAVYDDPQVTPRVILIEPTNARDYLSQITEQVSKLSHEQGGSIPFTIIREIVENFIHAAFAEPTISILNSGNVIRFSDQGPGIKDKNLALEFGTTSATEEMRHYIRGVGSGLPLVHNYMSEKGGSIQIQDNIDGGTVVTLIAAQINPQTVFPSQEIQQNQNFNQNRINQIQQHQFVQDYYQQLFRQEYPVQRIQSPLQQISQTNVKQDQNSSIQCSERGISILQYLQTNEFVGSKELTSSFGFSQPTWSRELKVLEKMGILQKNGQKYYLTILGKSFISGKI